MEPEKARHMSLQKEVLIHVSEFPSDRRRSTFVRQRSRSFSNGENKSPRMKTKGELLQVNLDCVLIRIRNISILWESSLGSWNQSYEFNFDPFLQQLSANFANLEFCLLVKKDPRHFSIDSLNCDQLSAIQTKASCDEQVGLLTFVHCECKCIFISLVAA